MAIEINLDKVLKKLDNVKNIDFSECLEKACQIIENDAKVNAPVSSGQLRRSITHEVNGNIGEVGTNVSYAPYVEYGTGLFAVAGNGRKTSWSYRNAKGEWVTTQGQKPQPFLEPALLKNKQKILEIFAEEIKKGVKK